MNDGSIFIAGLPSAGKSTFLAALWHLIRSGEISTALTYDGIQGIDVEYLNAIRAKWLEHKPIGRTKPSQEKLARINLARADGRKFSLSLPDFAGEGFRRMWLPPTRRATEAIGESARRAEGHLLLINVDKIVYPLTVDEYRLQLEGTGEEPGAVIPFDAEKSPTAAIVADILTSLENSPISVRPRRLAIALTAWDAVADEEKTPAEMLLERLPLVHQMLVSRSGEIECKVFGVSAQGLSYDNIDVTSQPDVSSHRILVVGDGERHHDLTRIPEWLLG
jgi:hypothetical protein